MTAKQRLSEDELFRLRESLTANLGDSIRTAAMGNRYRDDRVRSKGLAQEHALVKACDARGLLCFRSQRLDLLYKTDILVYGRADRLSIEPLAVQCTTRRDHPPKMRAFRDSDIVTLHGRPIERLYLQFNVGDDSADVAAALDRFARSARREPDRLTYADFELGDLSVFDPAQRVAIIERASR